jgi:hypothetical protein
LKGPRAGPLPSTGLGKQVRHHARSANELSGGCICSWLPKG